MSQFSEVFKEGNLSPGVYSFAQMKGVTSTTLVDFSCRFTWSVTNFDGKGKEKQIPYDLKPEATGSLEQTASHMDCAWNGNATMPSNQHYRSPSVCDLLNKPNVNQMCNHQTPPPPMYYPTHENPAYLYPKITPKTFSPVLIYQHPSKASSVTNYTEFCGDRRSIAYQPIGSRARVPICDQSYSYLSPGVNSVPGRLNLVKDRNMSGWDPWSSLIREDGLPWYRRDPPNTIPDPIPPSFPSHSSIKSLPTLTSNSSLSFIGGPSVGEFQTWRNNNARRQNYITDTRPNSCLPDLRPNMSVAELRPNMCMDDQRQNMCMDDQRPNVCVSDPRPTTCVADQRSNMLASDPRQKMCMLSSDQRPNMCRPNPSVSELPLPDDCYQKPQENPFSDSAKLKFFLDTKYGLCDGADLPPCAESEVSFKSDPGLSLTTDFTLDPNFSDPFLDMLQDPLLTFQTDECEDSKKGRKYKCPYCHVSCANNGQLKGHLRVHTGERPYRCEYPGCGRAFARNEELTRHRRIHSGIRPHTCARCGKKFGRKDHLNKHQKTHLKTAEKKVHMCRLPGCEQRYTRSDALARHQWGAHGIKSKAAKCRSQVRDSVESAI